MILIFLMSDLHRTEKSGSYIGKVIISRSFYADFIRFVSGKTGRYTQRVIVTIYVLTRLGLFRFERIVKTRRSNVTFREFNTYCIYVV